MEFPMMKCGHTANGIMNEKPVCAICAGLTENAVLVEENIPSLGGRQAECQYCHTKRESKWSLPFFEYRGIGSRYDFEAEEHSEYSSIVGGRQTDSFYCGCKGWN